MARSDSPARFDNSFIIRTIRDFFIGLMLIFAIELGARYAYILWDFDTVQKDETRAAAEKLAGDVRQIMLNRGGPVAARTVYPILERDHARLGLDIAIEPSADTVKAVRRLMKGPPLGIPADWPEGVHHEARVAVKAERFCIRCHSLSQPGDTLGWVTVRNYRRSHVALWWQDVRLSGLFAMGNVIIDTIILFVLLRLRMEPILSLRAVVARLAKAGSDLSHRAPVRSNDEFGELAHDLNLFLDRVSHISEDMARVLGEIGDLAGEIETVSTAIGAQAERLAAAGGFGGGQGAAVEAILDGLSALCRRLEDTDAAERLAALQRERAAAAAAWRAAEVPAETRDLDAAAADIRRLDERMRGLAAEGQRLLNRLGHELPAEQEQAQAQALREE